jgi:hypothetical protein
MFNRLFPAPLRVRCRSGRTLIIHPTHSVFSPKGDLAEGALVDPLTVDVEPDHPAALRQGFRLIVDNRVEVVETVA